MQSVVGFLHLCLGQSVASYNTVYNQPTKNLNKHIKPHSPSVSSIILQKKKKGRGKAYQLLSTIRTKIIPTIIETHRIFEEITDAQTELSQDIAASQKLYSLLKNAGAGISNIGRMKGKEKKKKGVCWVQPPAAAAATAPPVLAFPSSRTASWLRFLARVGAEPEAAGAQLSLWDVLLCRGRSGPAPPQAQGGSARGGCSGWLFDKRGTYPVKGD